MRNELIPISPIDDR